MVFRELRALIDACDVYAVRYPGRETRLQEPALDSIRALTEGVLAELIPLWSARPLVVFGHSLGALVAFELARRGRAYGLVLRKLIVSACSAPSVPDDDEPIAQLPRDEFLAELRELKGTPPDFFAHAELIDLLLPALRADFAAAESYVPSPGPKLTCPIVAFAGRDDDEPLPDEMRPWADETTASFALRLFDGEHFFVRDTAALVGALRAEVA
jgi:pyochelin biosynthetic protein PchC